MKIEMTKKVEKKNGVQFDPNKDYSWEVDDKIEISGATYGILRHLCSTILNEDKVVLASRALNDLNIVLKENVENGKFKDVPKEQAESEEEAEEVEAVPVE